MKFRNSQSKDDMTEVYGFIEKANSHAVGIWYSKWWNLNDSKLATFLTFSKHPSACKF